MIQKIGRPTHDLVSLNFLFMAYFQKLLAFAVFHCLLTLLFIADNVDDAPAGHCCCFEVRGYQSTVWQHCKFMLFYAFVVLGEVVGYCDCKSML